MEGSGHAARSLVAGVPRPGRAQLGLLCPPPSSRAPSTPPRGPRKEFSPARGVGLPFASRCSAAGSPSASLPPSSSPGPLLPRAAAPPPRTLAARLGLARPDSGAGLCVRGFPGTPPRVASGGRPSRSEGCPGSPPRSQPPPGSAKGTSGMPRPHPAPLEGARPYLPSPSSAPRPGPGLGLRGWGGGREPDLTGAGRGRRPRPRTPGSYLLGGPWGWGPGRPGAAPLPEAGGVGGRAAAPAKL